MGLVKLHSFRFSEEDMRQLDFVVANRNKVYRADSFLPPINRTQVLRNLIAVEYAKLVHEEEKVEASLARAKRRAKVKSAKKPV